MKKTARGFTLIELLVVIAIIAILGLVVFWTINPLDLQKRTRDSNRLADLAQVQQGITLLLQEASSTAKLLCNGADYPCTGKSSDANSKKNDGTGWVKVNFSDQKTVQVPALPADPTNDSTYYYEYKATADEKWEINATLESDKYKPEMRNTSDGGDNDDKYERGSDLTVLN